MLCALDGVMDIEKSIVARLKMRWAGGEAKSGKNRSDTSQKSLSWGWSYDGADNTGEGINLHTPQKRKAKYILHGEGTTWSEECYCSESKHLEWSAFT